MSWKQGIIDAGFAFDTFENLTENEIYPRDEYSIEDYPEYIVINAFIHNSHRYNSVNTNFPKDVITIVFNYYYVEKQDFFSRFGRDIVIHQNRRIMKQKKDGSWTGYTAYGDKVIDATKGRKYCWTFKIVSVGDGVAIGIDESVAKFINHDFCAQLQQETYSYAFYSAGSKYDNSEKIKYGTKFGSNDYVSMILQYGTETTCLSYCVRSKMKDTVAFDDIPNDKKWRMAVCVYGGNPCVQLLNFMELLL